MEAIPSDTRDPEPIRAEPEYAGFWVRLGAYLIDGLILNLISVTTIIALVLDLPLVWLLGVLISLPVSIAYFAISWSRTGSTPGMALLGVRVVRATGGEPSSEPIGIGRGIWRVVSLALASIPLFLGLLWVAWDRRKRGWHDMLAGTLVVRRPSLAAEQRRGSRRLVIAGALLGGVVVAGSFVAGVAIGVRGLTGVRDAAGRITEPGDMLYAALRVGDCFDQQPGETIVTVRAIPCDSPHTFEVFRFVTLEAESYPSTSRMTALAQEGCLPHFEDYVGHAFETSVWYVNFYAPAQEAWASGDRRLTCLIQNETQTPYRGSARNSAR